MSHNTCFVIMPFSETNEKHTEIYWTEHYEKFLQPIIEEIPDLKAHRSEPLRGDILSKIISDLVLSPVVVADLTDHNANVFWELGVRHSFKHGTITIAEEGTQLPFNLGRQGTLFYDTSDHMKSESFRTRFKEAIHDCLTNPNMPDSHVLETLSGRGTLFEIFRRDEAIRRLDAVIFDITRNLSISEKVIKTAQKNQDGQIPRNRIVPRFAIASVELLVTNRYIEQEQTFYEIVAQHLEGLISLNVQLDMWTHDCRGVEKWLLEEKEAIIRELTEFKILIEDTREKLVNK